jgi:hypothetical protein
VHLAVVNGIDAALASLKVVVRVIRVGASDGIV